ncbi:hypothetical protein SDC9_147548 [bioreactor metagenome]|uniref:Uncharacterized protein n=1 Tax=bioreactor metagenome TaxID=1076179 RepID=A0A645EHX5_9ZZZZ
MGISQPTYSQDQLDEITAKNDKGCMIDGKHYSMYEAEQLQRRIETEVRRQKDIANIAKAAGDDNLRRNAQGNINMLNKKYIQVCKASGLPSQKERMAVSDYRRISLTKIRKKPIIDSGAISGARNPFSKEAEDHAIKYYNSVRKMSTDIQKISKNTGIDISDITEIKKYIFYDEHDLGEEGSSLFDPDYMMAQSWQRLIEGTDIQQHDITLLKHELSEKKLVEKGFTQSEAHIQASKAYNYAKEEEKYYAEINKHYKK